MSSAGKHTSTNTISQGGSFAGSGHVVRFEGLTGKKRESSELTSDQRKEAPCPSQQLPCVITTRRGIATGAGKPAIAALKASATELRSEEEEDILIVIIWIFVGCYVIAGNHTSPFGVPGSSIFPPRKNGGDYP